MIRLGLVGYGLGGRFFHAPFVAAAEGIELAGIVTRDAARRAQAGVDFPQVPVFDSQADLLASGVDVVTITTPPATRRQLVLEAIGGRTAVVADKPFAPSARAGQELVDAAAAAGVPLAVFHNRRWDADIRTLRTVLDGGELGDPWWAESRFDLDLPDTLDAGPDGGLLRDLGTHLVDQMLWVFGPVDRVHAQLFDVDRPEGPTDAAFTVDLVHDNGVRSRVAATKLNRISGRELRVYSSTGTYVSNSTDVQTRMLFDGQRPAKDDPNWGLEPEDHWGVLHTAAGARPVPSAAGRYQDYYTQLAAALRGEAPLPVTGAEGVRTLAVLDAARESARLGEVVAVDRSFD